MSRFKCISWNVQSIRNKCAEVLEHVTDQDADVAFISETWMEADKNDITAEIKASGYKLIHNRRKDREKDRGGGVGVMLKTGIAHKHIPCKSFSSFEHSMVSVKMLSNTKLLLITIYRLQYITVNFYEGIYRISRSVECHARKLCIVR